MLARCSVVQNNSMSQLTVRVCVCVCVCVCVLHLHAIQYVSIQVTVQQVGLKTSHSAVAPDSHQLTSNQSRRGKKTWEILLSKATIQQLATCTKSITTATQVSYLLLSISGPFQVLFVCCLTAHQHY